jgi:hypothetical protein
MKAKIFIRLFVFFFFVFNGSDTSIAAVDAVGSFDRADCSGFYGWACDGDNYSQPLDVHFYVDGPADGRLKPIAIVSAGIKREQAVANRCGGKAIHGFYYALPEALRDGKQHTIYAYGISAPAGTNPLLGARIINCSQGTDCSGGSCVPKTTAEKRLDLTALPAPITDIYDPYATPQKREFRKAYYSFPLPGGVTKANVIGLSGFVALASSAAKDGKDYLANMLVEVGWYPGTCQQTPLIYDGGWDDPQLVKSVFSKTRHIASYILKSWRAGTVSTPTEFRFSRKMPIDGCVSVMIDWGEPEMGSKEVAESHMELIYDTVETQASVVDARIIGFENTFGNKMIWCDRCSLGKTGLANACATKIKVADSPMAVTDIVGNVSVAAFNGNSWTNPENTPWTAYYDYYLYNDCSKLTDTKGMAVCDSATGAVCGCDAIKTVAVAYDHYAHIPADAIKLYGFVLNGVGKQTVQKEVAKSFSAPLQMNVGSCIVGFTRFVGAGNSGADMESQITALQIKRGSPDCMPNACTVLGYTCGVASDGCGGTLNCGTCPNNYTCLSNKCAASCTNECTGGAKQCLGTTGYRTCGNYDADSCNEWSLSANCASGQVCSYPGFCANDAKPIGYFDTANCDRFTGWTCDPNAYGRAIDVHFYVDSFADGIHWPLIIVPANAGREQAVADRCGGYANHGFDVDIPSNLKDGKTHTIYAYAINSPTGSNNPLLGVKTVNCAIAAGTVQEPLLTRIEDVIKRIRIRITELRANVSQIFLNPGK